MEKYEINNDTVALYAMNNKTRVYEKKDSFVVNKDANTIMEESCEYFGSSLQGRRKGTENLIGSIYKAPIIVEESRELIFFPTGSLRSKNCTWLRLDQVDKFYYQGTKLIVEFKNGERISLNTTYGAIDNQILRATRLESVLRSRKNEKILQK